MSHAIATANRPAPDQELVAIADYVCNGEITSELAYQTARHCLIDSLGCALLALDYPACTKLLGPVVEGTHVPNATPVPGTPYRVDPVKAAWDIGCTIRWLDFNDTWLAAEWGHPSDNLGAILAVADHVSRKRLAMGTEPLRMRDVLTAMIQAHEIQGCLALANSFNRVGLDHVLLVRVASSALAMRLLGGSRDQVIDVLTHAWIDGSALRTYRHAPNTGPRKSWAAGDATSRAVQLAMFVAKGEIGYPTALSAQTWGFYDACFGGRALQFERPYGTYVMENILFKISYPAEFHAQTALEASISLHADVGSRIDEISRIEITTHESAIRIISKQGKLDNPADRDHCLQYIVAVGLLRGDLTADDYEDAVAADPRIDQLRELMVVQEDSRYSREYHEPDKRSIANAVQVFFRDGTHTTKVEIEYPLGHRCRRSEGIPMLEQKFQRNLAGRFPFEREGEIVAVCLDQRRLEAMLVNDFMDLVAK